MDWVKFSYALFKGTMLVVQVSLLAGIKPQGLY